MLYLELVGFFHLPDFAPRNWPSNILTCDKGAEGGVSCKSKLGRSSFLSCRREFIYVSNVYT